MHIFLNITIGVAVAMMILTVVAIAYTKWFIR